MSESGAPTLKVLAGQVGARLQQVSKRLITAESCTGGLIAATLTSIPGSSDWFEGAFVTYRLSAKTSMVGVTRETLDRHGPVSEPTVRAMAEGALANSMADVAVAVSGIAGPGGGNVLAPVGTVWLAWAVRDESGSIQCVQTAEHHLQGDRPSVREMATRIALEGLRALLRPDSQTNQLT